MNECQRCGKVTKPDSVHTCTPKEICEAEKKLDDLFKSDGDIIARVIKKIRKPIAGLEDR